MIEKAFGKGSLIFESYLKGNDFLPFVRRIIDPILSATISSYILERFYYQYEWLSITNYSDILDFIVKADFVIPLSIFVVIHLLLALISGLTFAKLNGLIDRFTKKLLSSKKENADFYNAIGKHFDTKTLTVISKREEQELERSIQFITKAVLVTIFYFLYLRDYGIGLFLVMLAVLIVTLFILWFLYVFIAKLPGVIMQLRQDADKIKNDRAD